jgi:tetratricopeptide (TPR) repeat protein
VRYSYPDQDRGGEPVGRRSRFTLILCAVACACGPAAPRGPEPWVEVKSPHFTVASNAGDKEARRIAAQFEQMRAVFHTIYPTFRVDSGEPLNVIAVRNEDSMKVLLPDYWAGNDRVHPAGLYLNRNDENFALLRTDISGSAESSYHSLYHEYTHGIMAMNFSGLPIWLNEGLAEFFGNTILGATEVQLGIRSASQLSLLKNSQLIPIDKLMNADSRSPYYNEQNQASIFYAESWAIVHYLMLDPDAIKQDYRDRYLKAWEETRDGAEAGEQTFGDLNKLQARIATYVREPDLGYLRMKPDTHYSPDDFASRPMSPAEALVVQADFLEHTNHLPEAREMLSQALQLEPNLASAHAGMGYLAFLKFSNDDAENEFKRATELNPQDFRSFFFQAEIVFRKSGYSAESTPQIVTYLEKAIGSNPDFAPAWAFLSVAYRQPNQPKEKALDAALKASHLRPAVIAYAVDIGDALIALNRNDDARIISTRVSKMASSPQDKSQAQSFANRLQRHMEYVANKQNLGAAAEPVDAAQDSSKPTDAPESASASNETRDSPGAAPSAASEEGLIREVDCSAPPGAKISFAILGDTLHLAADDAAKIQYRVGGKNSNADAVPCAHWKGRKARISYRPGINPPSSGEITAIDFLQAP